MALLPIEKWPKRMSLETMGVLRKNKIKKWAGTLQKRSERLKLLQICLLIIDSLWNSTVKFETLSKCFSISVTLISSEPSAGHFKINVIELWSLCQLPDKMEITSSIRIKEWAMRKRTHSFFLLFLDSSSFSSWHFTVHCVVLYFHRKLIVVMVFFTTRSRNITVVLCIIRYLRI